MAASALIFSRSSGALLWQSRRSYSPSAHSLLIPTQMTLLCLRSHTSTRARETGMKKQQGHGPRSMLWTDAISECKNPLKAKQKETISILGRNLRLMTVCMTCLLLYILLHIIKRFEATLRGFILMTFWYVVYALKSFLSVYPIRRVVHWFGFVDYLASDAKIYSSSSNAD